ncbi:13288_t:CDS:2, partial [Dentiscutata heterogama]
MSLLGLAVRFSRPILCTLQPRVFFQSSQKRAKQVEPAHKFPEYASSFKKVHLDPLRVSIKPALAENLVIPKDVEVLDTDLENSNAHYQITEVVMNSSKKIGGDETLTDTLMDDLLRIAKLNAFPLMIRNKPRYELYVRDNCVIAKPEFLIKSQDNVLVAVEDKHLDLVRPGSGYGEPQLAIEILSSGSENSRPYYDEKLGYFKDQIVFAIRVISTYVTFYKAVIPAKYWNELENGFPEEQSIEILRWPAINLKDSGFDLAEPDGRKRVLTSLINI